jgi:5-methylcytosine-specific restriction protein A
MASRWDTSNRKATLPPDWPTIRARILDRDGHACTICGAPANQVDHIRAGTFGGTDEPENLASLCAQHHAWKSSIEGQMAMRQARQRTLRAVPKHPGRT